MATVNVYRYDFYDSVLKRERRSVDYATGDAIMKMHGSILGDTVQSVDEEQLDNSGAIRAAHVFDPPPPRGAGRPEHRARS